MDNWEMHRWADGYMGRWIDGDRIDVEMARWLDGKMGVMARWGDG